jgi:hypothetical protein
MTENNTNKDYDFILQLEDAQEAERKFKRLLTSKETKFEVKTESNLWHNKGNIVVEYESYKQPSGIAATKADWWVHELRSREKETLAYLMFPVPVLRKICNDVMEEDIYARLGGENKAMRMLLLDLRKLLTRLQNASGKGDDVFHGWKRKAGNPGLHVRHYTTRDYEAVKNLYMQGDLYGGQFDPARDSDDRLATVIHADPEAILVCEKDGKTIGTVSLIEEGRVAWLFRFAVEKGDNENDAAKALYDTACGTLKSRGHSQVQVYTPMDDTRLEQRYRDLGLNKGQAYTCFWQDLK